MEVIKDNKLGQLVSDYYEEDNVKNRHIICVILLFFDKLCKGLHRG